MEGYTECQLQAGLQLRVFQFIPPWQRPQEWAAVGSGQQRLAKSRSSWSYSRGKHLTAVVSWTWPAGKRGKVLPGRRGENAVLVPSVSPPSSWAPNRCYQSLPSALLCGCRCLLSRTSPTPQVLTPGASMSIPGLVEVEKSVTSCLATHLLSSDQSVSTTG